MYELPCEILMNIISFLNLKEKYNFGLTCAKFFNILKYDKNFMDSISSCFHLYSNMMKIIKNFDDYDGISKIIYCFLDYIGDDKFLEDINIGSILKSQLNSLCIVLKFLDSKKYDIFETFELLNIYITADGSKLIDMVHKEVKVDKKFNEFHNFTKLIAISEKVEEMSFCQHQYCFYNILVNDFLWFYYFYGKLDICTKLTPNIDIIKLNINKYLRLIQENKSSVIDLCIIDLDVNDGNKINNLIDINLLALKSLNYTTPLGSILIFIDALNGFYNKYGISAQREYLLYNPIDYHVNNKLGDTNYIKYNKKIYKNKYYTHGYTQKHRKNYYITSKKNIK